MTYDNQKNIFQFLSSVQAKSWFMTDVYICERLGMSLKRFNDFKAGKVREPYPIIMAIKYLEIERGLGVRDRMNNVYLSDCYLEPLKITTPIDYEELIKKRFGKHDFILSRDLKSLGYMPQKVQVLKKLGYEPFIKKIGNKTFRGYRRKLKS